MIFDAKKELDRKRAITKVQQLLDKKKVFEVIEKKEVRTIKQNRYLHLILAWFALEYGETLEYVKQEIFKKIVNPDLFKTEYANRQTGEIRTAWKSSSDLDTGQMTTAIERFRYYSEKEAAIYLPEPKDLALLQEINYQIEKMKNYL